MSFPPQDGAQFHQQWAFKKKDFSEWLWLLLHHFKQTVNQKKKNDSSEPRTTVSHELQPHTDRLLFLNNEKKKIALMPLQDGEQKIPGKTDQRTDCEEPERGGGEVGQLCSSLQHT